jgi:hypothetical protein
MALLSWAGGGKRGIPMRMGFVVLLIMIASLVTAAAQQRGIQRLSWLGGCWEAVSSERTVEEQWMTPRGGSMVGVSRTVRGDSLVEFELVVIREQGDQLAYEAHPSGQPSAVFLSRALTDSTVVFENLQHDFPQRIGYQRSGPNSLLAWIEGTENGQSRRVDFSYRRAAGGGN